MTQETGVVGYYPEMGEARPEGQMEASLGHYGRHYYVKTPLVLKGRGIKYLDTYTAADTRAPERIGWHRYQVTEAAFERLKGTYRVVMQNLL